MGVRKIFGLLLFVSLTCCPAHAAGFYKWRDANGVMHITDHPPDEAVEAEVDSETRINKSPMGDLGFGSQVQVQEQGHLHGKGAYESKALQDTINNLESEISYLESQKRMDPSMERGGLRNDIRRKQEMLHDLYLERSGVSKEEIVLRKMQKNARAAQTANSIPQSPTSVVAPPRHGMTDQNGVFYAPAGNNYINTRTGSVVIPQGGKTYLDTRTGTIMHGN
jgi:hypothetical protein